MHTDLNFFNQLNLLIKNNVSLVQALTVLSGIGSKRKSIHHVRQSASAILDNLTKGYSFSKSLFLCPYLHIKKTLLSLIEAAEHSAKLQEMLDFICIQQEQKERSIQEIKSAALYPFVVVVIALSGTFALMHWKDLFLTSITNSEILSVIFRALIIFVCLTALLGLYVYKSLKTPRLFTLYYTLGFLQESGFTFKQSLELCMTSNITSIPKKNLYTLYIQVSKGNEISMSALHAKLADEHMACLLKIAQECANVGPTCSLIAKGISKKSEVAKNQCLKLMEPILLFNVGIYILILMDGILIPYLTDFGGII